ncbi:hypothetical protein FQA39_LY09030 [Lamprigera yunnana]|nr:hypothetical protein FQA39_LY09030 [Lamprigera yunnana]
MKAMFVLMQECSKQFSNYFLKQGDFVEVELKDAFIRFGTDVIATTAFGVTCDSLSQPKNEFYMMAKRVSSVGGGVLFLLNFLVPTLAKYVKVPVFEKDVSIFFRGIVKDAIRLRKEKGIVRPDMLHLLMEAQKGNLHYEENKEIPDAGFAVVEESQLGRTRRKHKIEITDEVITAQVLIFFLGGFDTVSTTLSFVIYELAVNPDIQERLYIEVKDVMKNSNNELTYDNLMSIAYLDMVISETLRKWPPFITTDRVSIKPFTIESEKPEETTLTLEEGSVVIFPLKSIHRDPKYYPNPEKFDPERFNDENKHTIDPYTYFPFGVGPRNCIGSRFALLECKLIASEIISKFKVFPISKTKIPVVLSKSKFTPIPDEDILAQLKRIYFIIISERNHNSEQQKMWLIVLSILVAFVYFYLLKPLNYWKERNVVYEKGYPIVGSNLDIVLRRHNSSELFELIYKKYANKRYVGIFSFSTPALLINDPKLVKRIMVKEFETFPEHRQFIATDVDTLWSKNLFAMKGGEEWHELRATLSPSFTSSKMKAMFVLMKECSKQFSHYFSKRGDFVEVELKDAFVRCGTDIIATTAFGVTCDSLAQPKNEFYMMAKKLNAFSGFKGLVFLLNFLLPSITKYIKIPMINKKVGSFFRSIVKDAIRVRKENGIVRPDMLHLLMEAQKGNLNYEENNDVPDAGFAAVEESQLGRTPRKHKMEITDEVITAQVLIFFFAGFDTVSTLLSFVIYELALNANIQERLYREVNEALQKSNAEFTYDSLMNMKYLDMVISGNFTIFIESRLNRLQLNPKDRGESTLTLEKGTIIMCPVKSIQRDPKHYPNPDKFDPERFSEENKHKIDPYTYLAFGVGPRNCIGSRFALLECKLIVAEIISKFHVVPVSKTKIPIVLSKSNFNPIPDEVKTMNYWKERNVVYEKGYPIVGNNLDIVLRKRSNTDVFEKIYKKYSNRRYVGIFSFSTPALLINDPNLMKRIMVKEFETFPEHRRFFLTDVDPLWNKNLFAMKVKTMNYWKERNVVYEKGYPIVGNNLDIVLRKRSNTDVFEKIYKKYSNRRYVGIFSFSTPALLINDPNLMKRIMVKEFETFPEHRRFFPTDVDPLWNKNLFAMKGGEEWHDLRSTLSPSFTSSKMKAMFVLMKECSKQFSNYFLKQEDHRIEVELKDAFARFGTDVIATTAFGVTCNSLEQPKNEFYMMAKRLNTFSGLKGLVFLLNFLAPNIAKYIKIPVFDKKVATFFRSIVKDAIRVRKEKGVVRPDMLHLLMEAQKGNLTYEENNGLPDAGFAAVEESQLGKTQRKHKVEVTDEIITAQVLIFFFAGFETVSTLLSFIIYELAINHDIQEILYREANEVLENSNGEFTYDNLMNMKYLDMVISGKTYLYL